MSFEKVVELARGSSKTKDRTLFRTRESRDDDSDVLVLRVSICVLKVNNNTTSEFGGNRARELAEEMTFGRRLSLFVLSHLFLRFAKT